MIVINKDNIQVPEFLNEQFFLDTIQEGLRLDKVEIKELNFEWGSNPGDNYCSAIYRVKVTYERRETKDSIEKETRSLIVKTIPISQETQFLEDVAVFIKEKLTYLDVLPRLEILSDNEKFGAKYFYSIEKPVQTIVFNDLKLEGFRTASRQEGLDWDHASLLLRQLAKFHATSMILAKKDPEIKKRFTKGMLCPETIIHSPTFKQMFGGSLEQLIKVSAKWPGYEQISKHLQRFYDNFESLCSQLGSPKSNDRFVVLNHSDMWTNNFMYAYDDPKAPTKPTRVIFVDFQLSFFGSPACDINFFLSTSVQLPVLKQRRDDLILEYYNSFVETLKYLRYDPIPSFDDLKFELRSRELYGFFGLFGFLPIVTMPAELSTDSSIESLAGGDSQKKKMEAIYAQPKLREFYEFGLSRLDKLGVFQEF